MTRSSMVRTARRLQSGAGMVEYALLVSLIAVAVIGVLRGLGSDIVGVFEAIRAALATGG